jgi:hypothetical protein
MTCKYASGSAEYSHRNMNDGSTFHSNSFGSNSFIDIFRPFQPVFDAKSLYVQNQYNKRVAMATNNSIVSCYATPLATGSISRKV